MRTPAILAVLLALLAGCGVVRNVAPAATTTTTTTSTTTTSTTEPDPATFACQDHVNNADVEARPEEAPETLERLTTSRDARVARAATKVDHIIRDRSVAGEYAVPPELDVEYAEAELDLARACKAGGFLGDVGP